MSNREFTSSELDEVLKTIYPLEGSNSVTSIDGTEELTELPFVESGYEGKIDYRIRQLSYSSLLLLHSCPRKFELYKKRSSHKTEESEKSSITFAYGHAIGTGIQEVLIGLPVEKVLMNMFLAWPIDIFSKDEKANKDFWTAIHAIQKFITLREQGFLSDYELVYYEGKPAVELSFCINFPDGFRLRGFVDAVLRNIDTGEIIVLECKTTAMKLNPGGYKNSAQAIGYSIVLDTIFPELSSYKVLYLVYHSKDQDYTPIPFNKTYLQRALWIRELLLDIDIIKLYEEAEVYPMHGESCLSWGRECEYFQTCTLSTAYLTNNCTAEEEDKTEYQISIGLEALLESQFNKMNSTDVE